VQSETSVGEETEEHDDDDLINAGKERLDEDEYDFSYDPAAFTANSSVMLDVKWPTESGLAEADAEAGCRARIVSVASLGRSCFDSLGDSEEADVVVRKCIEDVQMTGDFAWASDKVSELQRLCVYEVTSRNYSDIVNTSSVRDVMRRDVIAVTSQRCDPFDCNGHGSCVEGRCVCHTGYIGVDCLLSETAVPSIIRLMDSVSDCDIRTRLCRSAALVVKDINQLAVTCRVKVTQLDGTQTVFVAMATITSSNTITCPLPRDSLSRYSVNADFSTGNETNDRKFEWLPPGGAVQTYSVAISNDAKQFSAEKRLRIVDTLCMECDEQCRQRTGTCLINGYCFSSDDSNPLDAQFACRPHVTDVKWTRVSGDDKTFAVIVAVVSSCLVVLIITVAAAVWFITRTLRRKMNEFH
jgi:hypothetical protein